MLGTTPLLFPKEVLVFNPDWQAGHTVLLGEVMATAHYAHQVGRKSGAPPAACTAFQADNAFGSSALRGLRPNRGR